MSGLDNNTRVALLGECLIELNGKPFGTLHQTFGGDSLNTAIYLTRLLRDTAQVQYLSALGTDSLSDGILARCRAEGVDVSCVLRDENRLPGLYFIQLDADGERAFLYWRSESAARYLLRHPQFDLVAAALRRVKLIYLTGISLAILISGDREKLTALLIELAASGKTLVLDTNYRAALWSSAQAARDAIAALLPSVRLLLTTFDDEHHLWGDKTPEAASLRVRSAGVGTAVVKLGAAGCLYSDGITTDLRVPALAAAAVVDTTAAGDAFNAAFLAGWLQSRDPLDCCRLGNALAGIVIQHPGALIPEAATPTLRELLKSLV